MKAWAAAGFFALALMVLTKPGRAVTNVSPSLFAGTGATTYVVVRPGGTDGGQHCTDVDDAERLTGCHCVAALLTRTPEGTLPEAACVPHVLVDLEDLDPRGVLVRGLASVQLLVEVGVRTVDERRRLSEREHLRPGGGLAEALRVGVQARIGRIRAQLKHLVEGLGSRQPEFVQQVWL